MGAYFTRASTDKPINNRPAGGAVSTVVDRNPLTELPTREDVRGVLIQTTRCPIDVIDGIILGYALVTLKEALEIKSISYVNIWGRESRYAFEWEKTIQMTTDYWVWRKANVLAPEPLIPLKTYLMKKLPPSLMASISIQGTTDVDHLKHVLTTLEAMTTRVDLLQPFALTIEDSIVHQVIRQWVEPLRSQVQLKRYETRTLIT